MSDFLKIVLDSFICTHGRTIVSEFYIGKEFKPAQVSNDGMPHLWGDLL